jgi:Winged helix DNA-binding domain
VGAAASGPLLTRRVLNRTLLARQGLLERVARDPLAVVEDLVGLQAQEPIDPYVALWSRIADFDPASLSAAIVDRRAVRIGLMRTTLHLVATDDALGLAPVMDGVLRRVFRSTPFAKALVGVDADTVIEEARMALAARPMTPTDLGRHLATRWPDVDASAMAYLARYHLPLVQVPPRGLWQRTGRATNTTLDAWTGRSPVAVPVDDIVLRYLRAFGPASVADIRTWSWMTGLRAVVDRLRPQLRSFRDERGRELLDVEDGWLLEEDVPAPVRFLPQYDNLFLSHDDRSRINGEMSWGVEFGWKGPILVDGGITGAWRVRREKQVATMTIELGRTLTKAERRDLDEEAERLAAFLDPVGARERVLVPPA